MFSGGLKWHGACALTFARHMLSSMLPGRLALQGAYHSRDQGHTTYKLLGSYIAAVYWGLTLRLDWLDLVTFGSRNV